MAGRVFFHIGLPKTGTSYLQTIMWGNRDRLRAAGVLLPGAERRDHLWASCVARGDPNTACRNARAPSSWDRIVDEIGAWAGDAVISHEFFSSASTAQATSAVARLAPGQVHLVVTARDTLDLFTSSWQESVKNKETTPIGAYCASLSEDPLAVWDWRALDLGLVLGRWAEAVPPERVHVLPVPRAGSGTSDLWQRFAGLIGAPSDGLDLSQGFPNRSMGVAETETLRRINLALEGFDRPFDRGVWIRTYLADERLVPRGGDAYWPSAAQIAECRRRGQAAVDLIRVRGFDVVGALVDLCTPERLPLRRHPDSVTDAEVAAVAVDLVAGLLTDVRRLTNARRRQSAAAAAAAAAAAEPEVVAVPGPRERLLSRAVRLAGRRRSAAP